MRGEGFTLLEVLVAMMVFGLVIAAGVQALGMGAVARERAATHAELRTRARWKLSQVRALSGHELRDRIGVQEGVFGEGQTAGRWRTDVHESEAGNGLFRVGLTVALDSDGSSLRSVTYINRFGSLWSLRER